MRFFKSLWLIPMGERLSVSPFFLIMAAAAMFFGYADMFFIAYLSAFFHECAHIAAARSLRVGISRIEILPFGICGKLGAGFVKNPYKEILIAAAGPLCSGILALSLCFVSPKVPELKALCAYAVNVNLALLLINLVPALPLDGGRIVKGLISINSGAVRAYNIMLRVSRFPIAVIVAVSVMLLLMNDFNLSLIMIGAFLLGNLSFEQKNLSMISLREMLYYKDALRRDRLCPVIRMAAHSEARAGLFLRRLGSYKYHIIDVIDDNGEIIKTVTESQIISALINRSVRLTMGEI